MTECYNRLLVGCTNCNDVFLFDLILIIYFDLFYNQKQVDITISKNQALQI